MMNTTWGGFPLCPCCHLGECFTGLLRLLDLPGDTALRPNSTTNAHWKRRTFMVNVADQTERFTVKTINKWLFKMNDHLIMQMCMIHEISFRSAQYDIILANSDEEPVQPICWEARCKALLLSQMSPLRINLILVLKRHPIFYFQKVCYGFDKNRCFNQHLWNIEGPPKCTP